MGGKKGVTYMIRRKKGKSTKRWAAAILAAVVLMESGLGNVRISSVFAKEQEESTVSVNEISVDMEFDSQADIEAPPEENTEPVIYEDTDEVLGEAAAYLANTETKKVEVDITSIATTQIYRDMDYSFLKEYEFGTNVEAKPTVTFGSTEELGKSKDLRLTAGRIIKTEGYYESGDGGSAVYEILTEYDMGKANRKEGAIQLANGLYACILPDVYEINGQKWILINVKQYGAIGDGVTPAHAGLSAAFSSVSKHVAWDDAEDNEIVRGIAYIPAGEYKCAKEVTSDGLKNVNIVGDGDSTVLFTDNDYRKDEGYSEFFFAVWNASNTYFGDFRIEAREVDLYNYMRQFVLVYCDNIYIYNVDLIVPQEAYSGYYYEDKQYSNFTCYSGDTNITVDACTMIQFSGTYRGANVGILDFWDKEVKNITVMNCDLYSNARDEQIGIFNIPKTGAVENKNTSIRNIDLINNTIHTTPVKYEEVVGNQNMCFTVAYAESVRIDDVRIAGNHFICEVDSKFMTFGNITNCVVENNIIEITSTRNNGASVFDSSNSDTKNILIRNNEFFLTSTDGKRGKASFTQGKMTFEGNRVVSDGLMTNYVVGQVAKNNVFIFLKQVSYITAAVDLVENNTFYLYGGASGGNCNGVFDLSAASGKTEISVKNNTVYDYKYHIGKRAVWQALANVAGYDDKISAEFSGNTYYAPNRKFTSADHYSKDDVKADVDWITDENGKDQITGYYNRMFYMRVPDDTSTCNLKELIFENNTLQGVKGYVEWNNGVKEDGSRPVEYVISNNTTLPYNENLSEDNLLASSVDILYNNEKATEIAVTGDTVKLDKIVRVAERDEDGNILEEQEVSDKEIKWYTSVDSMATVSQDGTVTRKLYGDVKVFAVATDGSAVYGECTIHFLKNTATSLSFSEETVELQPGLKYYADYVVLPEAETSQNLKWTSSDENVATVSKTGLITAVSVGKAVITGTTTDGTNLSASLSVNVTPVTVKKMTMDNTWLYFTQEQIGESKQLAIKNYTPDNAANKSVKRWESTDRTVATVDAQGKVKVVGSGRTEIRAYSTDEYCYAKCVIYVQSPQVTNFKATSVLKNKVTLSWDPVEKSYGYFLYQWNSSTNKWEALNNGRTLEKDTTSYSVSNLTAGTEYKFCVRAYYWNNSDLEHCPYESKDSIVTVKTYGYNPVTSITGASDVFTIVDYGWKNHQDTFTIKYNSNADYENLDFDYKIADESIVKIVSVEDGSNAGEKSIKLEGLKYGTTTLTVTANDGGNASAEIPVGFIINNSVSNCEADPVYKQTTISFDGLEDESNIDGYYVRSMVTMYTYNEVAYIPKTGAGTYSVVDKNVNVGAGPQSGGYRYVVSPCLTDGTNYYLGAGKTANESINNGIVQIPEPTKAESLEMGQTRYVVKGGETIEVSASVGNEDASTSELYWEVINENYAGIERVERTDGEILTDYAKVTGKNAGVTKIKAVTTDGSEIEKYAKLIVAPQSVENLKAESQFTNVTLSWTDIKNADGYGIYRWVEKKNKFELLAETTEASYKDTGLEADTAYRYKIAAYIHVEGVRYDGNYSPEIGVATASTNYGIYATGYSGCYDGKSHNAVTLKGVKENIDKVTYSIDSKNWSAIVPTVTEVKDSGNVYIKIERQGQTKPYQITVAATVSPVLVEQTDIVLKTGLVEWDGKNHTPEVVSSTCAVDKDYTVSGIKKYKNQGIYTITVTGMGNYTGTKKLTYKIQVVKGHKYKLSGYIYKVTGSSTVSVTGITNKKKTTVTVKDTVKIGGKKYKITAIGNSAFKNCKKLKKVTIGKYVTTIGKNAFYGDKKLKKIVIKTKKLKKVGKNALKGISKTAQIQVPKSKRSKYKKLFKKSTGYVSTMKVK